MIVATAFDTADIDRVLNALRLAHKPPLVVAIGWSEYSPAGASLGSVVYASEVLAEELPRLTLTHPGTIPAGIAVGAIDDGAQGGVRASAEIRAIAKNRWAYPVAAACATQLQPAAILTLVREMSEKNKLLPAGRSPAAQAGALLRSLWVRPKRLIAVARRQSRLLEQQAALADAVEAFLLAADPRRDR